MVRSGTLQATLTSAFSDVYDKFGSQPAVLGPDGPVLTYGELGARARRLVHGLTRLGAGTGDRVVVVTANRAESFVVDHALAAGGFVRVALSIRLHPREVVQIARDCAARVAFVDTERECGVVTAFAEAGLDVAVVALEEPAGPVAARYADLLSGPELDPAEPDPEDLAWLPCTSGTTGGPKGVLLSHRNLLAYCRNLMAELPPIDTQDVVLHVAPLTHLSGYVSLPFQLRGAQHVPLASFDAESALRASAEHEVTVLPIVPTMLNMMLPALETGMWDTHSLHTVVYAGSAIPPDRLARPVELLEPVFVQCYGLTTPDGRDAAEGEEGEIHVRGDITMLGYWNRPEVTAEVLLGDGWVATGDIGRFHDCYQVTAEDIERICRERIASYKRPRSVEFVDVIPKTGAGKIQRNELRRRHWAGADRRLGG